MQYKDIISIFNETGLSPENLSKWIGVSNSTYRRWLRAPPTTEFPAGYVPNVSAGIYRLLAGGMLKYGSARVEAFIRRNVPEYFSAAITALGEAAETMPRDVPHEEKLVMVLANLGNSVTARSMVESESAKIMAFESYGQTWKHNVVNLMKVVKSGDFSSADKLVAYGALFYLLLPLDLIPDAIPVFGYIDDFGVLCAATAHYSYKFPAQFPSPFGVAAKAGA